MQNNNFTHQKHITGPVPLNFVPYSQSKINPRFYYNQVSAPNFKYSTPYPYKPPTQFQTIPVPKLPFVPLPPRELNGRYLFYGKKMAFSNFFESPFNFENHWYRSSEQFYQERKALFFKDYNTARKIMYESDPAIIKLLSYGIVGYNKEKWQTVAGQTMRQGLIIKFQTYPILKKILLNTGNGLIIEANPHDLYWGTGIPFRPPYKYFPYKFPGQNNMGHLLMELREAFRTHQI